MKLSSLHINEPAIIQDIEDKNMEEILMEIGCFPGEKVQITQKAPMGDPIIIHINQNFIGLRAAEADAINVKLIE